jgi:hypothetical protein
VVSKKAKKPTPPASWPFADPPNVAVFVSPGILASKDFIYYVCRDEDDGAWSFHPKGGRMSVDDAKVVSLQSVVDRDPSIAELADLPRGWCAWREDARSAWQRAKQE